MNMEELRRNASREAVHEKDEATYKLIKRGKGPFRLLECQNCKESGWWGVITPKYCPHCGKKVKMEEDKYIIAALI